MTDQTVDASALIEDLTRALDGRYVIGDVLGFGRGGVSLHARQVSTGREIALKVAWDNPLAREQVRRETELTAEAADAHVLPMLALDTVGGLVAVEMPVAAGSVDDLLEPGKPVPFARVIAIISAAANALDRAHAKGIVHGGLRPSKLLLDAQGEVLVTDFALRVPPSSDPNAAKPSTVGLAAYTPIEQRHDSSTVNGRVDQFALAVIAFELLRGRRMWHVNADGVLEIDAVEMMPTRPVAPGVPLSANTAIKRATSKEPGFRYQSVAEFAQALSQASLYAEPAEHTYRRGDVGKKRRSALWLVLPVVALIAAGAALKPQMRDNVREWWHSNWSINIPHAGDIGPSASLAGEQQGSGKPTIRGSESQADRTTRRTENTRLRDSTGDPRSGANGRTFDPFPRNVSGVAVSTGAGTAAGNAPNTRSAPASARIEQAAGSTVSSAAGVRAPSANRGNSTQNANAGAISASIKGAGAAVVVIDGVARGTTPFVWEGEIGTHTVRLRGLQSFSPESVTVTVLRGDTVRLSFTAVPRG